MELNIKKNYLRSAKTEMHFLKYVNNLYLNVENDFFTV